jgi:tRNA nucleotidyltransferase (CCA-adding enzyme)
MTIKTFLNDIASSIYRVGGCVRDGMLCLPVNDVDYVVVGVSAAAMLAAGFKQVGADFPVFLHPETQDEYALARTERKTGAGYSGFKAYADESVTLEDDLQRRDYTINAMAINHQGVVFDPYDGQDDLQRGILRHVGPAFSEDPMRVLRGARFAARYGFSIAPETEALMVELVQAGEMEHITRERIVVELEKGFTTSKPSVMLAVLQRTGALSSLFPEADQGILNDVSWYPDLDDLARSNADLGWAFLLAKTVSSPCRPVAERWRVGKDAMGVASTLDALSEDAVAPLELSPDALLTIWTKCDARRQPGRFFQALRVRAACAGLAQDTLAPILSYWERVDRVLRSVIEGDVLKSKPAGQDPQSWIRIARLAALQSAVSAPEGLTRQA